MWARWPVCRAVLFDLYGTLADLETDEDDPAVWRGLADWAKANIGRRQPWEQMRLAYRNLCEEKAKIHGAGFILREVFGELLGSGATNEDVRGFAHEFRRLSTCSLKLRPYSVPLLRQVRRDGIRLALVSNTEGILTDFDLNRLGLRQYFDAIVLSSEVGFAKPDRRILQVALEELSCSPSSTVFVGDSWDMDMKASIALNIPCIIIISDQPRPPEGDGVKVAFSRPVLEDIYVNIMKILPQ